MVCRKFETSRRREDLTFNHHREVAALAPDEADALLDWCGETVIHLSCVDGVGPVLGTLAARAMGVKKLSNQLP
jgi:hypothetical protein